MTADVEPPTEDAGPAFRARTQTGYLTIFPTATAQGWAVEVVAKGRIVTLTRAEGHLLAGMLHHGPGPATTTGDVDVAALPDRSVVLNDRGEVWQLRGRAWYGIGRLGRLGGLLRPPSPPFKILGPLGAVPPPSEPGGSHE